MTEVLRCLAAVVNRRDWVGLRAYVAADHQVTDHRRIVSLTGDAGIVERVRGFVELAADFVFDVEPLAEIDGVAMSLHRYHGHLDDGGGDFEIHTRNVVRVQDGLITHAEPFDADDEAAMLAAVARLRTLPQLGPATRLVERVADSTNTRDLATYQDCFTEDVAPVDHRTPSIIGRFHSRDDAVEWARLLFEQSANAHWEITHLGELGGVYLGRGGWVGRADDTGAEFEIMARYVFPTRDGRICGIEMFDPDDEVGSVRALCRLAGGDEADSPVTALVGRLVQAFATRDWERVRACFAPSLHTVDRRRVTALALDAQSGDGVVERTRGMVALAADARPNAEMLGEIDGIGMVRIVWSGHLDDGGGPFELSWRGVIVAHDDVIVRYELFDADDETGMLAAVVRLRAGGQSATG